MSGRATAASSNPCVRETDEGGARYQVLMECPGTIIRSDGSVKQKQGASTY